MSEYISPTATDSEADPKHPETPVSPEIAELTKMVRTANDLIHEVFEFSIEESTLPKVELLTETKTAGFVKQVLIRIIRAGKGELQASAKAFKETRVVQLSPTTPMRDVVHEMGHFTHWDLYDEVSPKNTDETQPKPQDKALDMISQAWEEGIAQFFELEVEAHQLITKAGQKPSRNNVEQTRLSVFEDRYMKDERWEAAVARYTSLIESVTRFEAAQEQQKTGENKISPIQLMKDIRVMSTTKEVLYEIGYAFVIDVVQALVKSGLKTSLALEIVMSNAPQSIEEITQPMLYLKRVNPIR